MPSGEGGKQDECEEGEDDGDNEQVRENNGILEGSSNPDEVQRVLVNGHVVDERCGIVGADEATAVSVDADAEVADAHTKLCVADNVGNCGCDTGVDLFRCVGGCELFVPHGDEEDAGDEW